ncbi:MAG: hypothetical protein WDO73_04365, partial [Ignavibacteriota bacterium]
MPAAIKNLTLRPVFVPLNSGTNVRLSPGGTASNIDEVELRDNSKFNKLVSQRAIAVDKGEAPKAAKPAEAAPARARKKDDSAG